MIVATENSLNYERIGQAIAYLERNVHRQPSLDEVAESVHLSPFHFQRIFTEWAGISPKRFLQYLTVDFLKSKLHQSRTLTDAADEAGLSGQSRIYDLFTTLEAVTPGEYKVFGEGIRIRYGFHDTPFGKCLIGLTSRGICWLSFISNDNEERELEAMKAHWNRSVFQNDPATSDAAEKVFSPFRDNIMLGARREGLHLFVKGTNFQVKVWEALLRIPTANIVTYQQIAGVIGQPGASQAVGSAVGSNHIAYLIPCHRVIRKDGLTGEYRWDAARKRAIIGLEMARAS